MKTRLLYFPTILFMLLLGTCACQKEENEQDEKTNHFKYEGKTYELHKGIIEYYGPSEGDGHYFFVTLFSDGISFVDETFSGTGHIVYLGLYSNNSSELSPGKYIYDIDFEEGPFTFDFALFGISLEIDGETGTILYALSGTVKVSRDGSKYIFEMDHKTIFNKDVSGYFKGDLTFYDWSWK